MEKSLGTYVALGVLLWAILGTAAAIYYFLQYDTYLREYDNLADQFNEISLKANILLSFGNGTRIWKNDTVLPIGSTAFNATRSIVYNLSYTDYGGELGILVTSIDGVSNNSTHGWFFWYFDADNMKWVLPNHSSGRHLLHEGDVIAFAYSSYMAWPPPPPT